MQSMKQTEYYKYTDFVFIIIEENNAVLIKDSLLSFYEQY